MLQKPCTYDSLHLPTTVVGRRIQNRATEAPFHLKLDQNNGWVKLAHLIPWDELASIYHRTLNATHGAPVLDARLVIGAMIIKDKEKPDDREAIEYIR